MMKKDFTFTRKRQILGFCLALGFFTACVFEGPENPKSSSITIASWNVQTMFDGNDDGSEYDEFQAAAGWTEEKYRSRLNVLSGAIKQLADGGADIVALIEIENYRVLEDIALNTDYNFIYFANNPGAALGLGVLSRFPVSETRTHSANFSGTESPRPVVEFLVEAGTGREIVFMLCHWKSKLGGGEATEAVRQAEAAVIARRIGEINARPGMPVIVMGDLNENHDEFIRSGESYICALMPDTEAAALLARNRGGGARPDFQDFLIVSGSKPPRAEYLDETPALYSPWMESAAENETLSSGSYYYKDQWETIDHFLLNASLFDGTGWEFEDFHAVSTPAFTTAAEKPYAFNPRTGNGISDHLPIILTLEYK